MEERTFFESKGWCTFMAWFSLIATVCNIVHLYLDGINDRTAYVVWLLAVTAFTTGRYFTKLEEMKLD